MGCIGGRCGRRWRRRCRRSKRAPVGRPAPKLGAYRALIDGWLEADRDAPRKQRHTARRIWQRLVDEHGAEVAESTVRQYVRARKRRAGLAGRGGVRAAGPRAGRGGRGRLGRGAGRCSAGVSVKVHLFVMRASFSGAAFCQASLVETQQAFLEVHVAGVRVVRRRVRADPLRQPDVGGQAGAARAAGGSRPTGSSRCARTTCSSRSSRRPGIEGAHEKGGVEGEVGRFRRNHLVPVPAVRDPRRAQRAAARAAARRDLGAADRRAGR